jgi:hypothetical protein
MIRVLWLFAMYDQFYSSGVHRWPLRMSQILPGNPHVILSLGTFKMDIFPFQNMPSGGGANYLNFGETVP